MSEIVEPGLVALTRAIFEDQLPQLQAQVQVRANQADTVLTGAALIEQLRDADVVLACSADRMDAALIEQLPRLRGICNIAVGYNNIDLAACTARGIAVTNTPGVLTETTADLAFALLMAAARRVPQSERWLRHGQWQHWALQQWLGKDVHGATLGIVGMGRIGSALARRGLGFGMRIVYNNRSAAPDEAQLGAIRLELDALLAAADFVVLLLPYSAATHHLIGSRELRLMKPDAILVNVARGGIVDDAALVDALRAGQLGGAGLDVFENEPALHSGLLDLDNVVLTPHIGSASQATRRAMSQCAVDNALAILAGQRPPNQVNT